MTMAAIISRVCRVGVYPISSILESRTSLAYVSHNDLYGLWRGGDITGVAAAVGMGRVSTL